MEEGNIFKIYYNRSMPLFCCEYWDWGERIGVRQMTGRNIGFTPLFISRSNLGIDVHYGMITEEHEERLVTYYTSDKRRFLQILERYEKACTKLMTLVRSATLKDRVKILNLHKKTWPLLTVVMLVGEWYGEEMVTEWHYQQVQTVRIKTEKVEYASNNKLLKMLMEHFPKWSDYLDVLTGNEIINLKFPLESELKRRKDRFFYFQGRLYSGISVSEFEKATNIKLRSRVKAASKISNIIKGLVAMSGKVVGKVKVVIDHLQMDKVKPGDILVTPMTTPDYLLAMKRAAAFVTDEGGIMCHAAIVAREIGKPCIIGTKNATQILKDGDMVEVDAREGIIRILK